jgi:hypothetical protein
MSFFAREQTISADDGNFNLIRTGIEFFGSYGAVPWFALSLQAINQRMLQLHHHDFDEGPHADLRHLHDDSGFMPQTVHLLSAFLGASVCFLLVKTNVSEPAAMPRTCKWNVDTCYGVQTHHWMRSALVCGSLPAGLRISSEGKTEMMLALPSVTSTMAPLSALGTYRKSEGETTWTIKACLPFCRPFEFEQQCKRRLRQREVR